MTQSLLRPALAALLALGAGGAAAQDEGEEPSMLLPPLVITAPAADGAGAGLARVERSDLLGAFQGAGIEGVLNGIPSVTTQSTPGDPAIAVNIRGFQDNGRVVTTIDGARQNFARSGHGANGTFYADPEMLRSVEVVRGPAGAEAAVGAIGGTLALRTVEAADLIAPGAIQGGEMRLRYGTLTAQPTAHVAYARRFGAATDALLAFTRAATADYDAGDGVRVQAEDTTLSGLGKLGFGIGDAQLATLSYSTLDSRFDTGAAEGIPRRNRMDTSNAVATYQLSGPVSLDATLYRTETRVEQQLLEDDLWPIGPKRSYTTTTTGLRGVADGAFALGPTDHALSVVLDAFHDDVDTRDPAAFGGSLTPSGTRDVASALVQDAIALGDRTEAVLGLRFTYYGLDSDDGDASDTDVAPSLTLSRRIGEALTLHATLAKAYRPPTLSETLVNGLHPPPATFYILPNPDLKPESALSAEIGARLAFADLVLPGDALDASLTAYRNEVSDYIGLVQRGTLFEPYFQYDNISKVRIEGWELEIAYDADRVFGSVAGQLMKGTDRATGEEVAGVQPNRLTLTAGLRNPGRTLEAGGRLNIVGSREDGALSSQAWTTLDLFLTRSLGPAASLGLALNNVADETYTQYLNTQPSPGFNAQASLSIAF